ncbi:MAG: hypothetical protein II983_06140 [Firmicutes bacterium]|nr:hypothetical protein [Methanobrevibacter sp.]MBQ4505237.1 hypothetical protein [Bacillota bacterium]MBR0371641.1 hypothetical protein [Methanobrevibacter sp.]
MVKVHYMVQNPREDLSEQPGPVIDELVNGYRYYLQDGVFQLEYWIQDDMGQPPIHMRINRNWIESDSIFLELITSQWVRSYSIKEESTKLMTAMSDYETEINLETITQEIEW